MAPTSLARPAKNELPTDFETEICVRFASRVRLFAVRHLDDAAATDDFVQHVMLAVIEALRQGRLRDEAQLGAYILGTCRMLVRDDFRRDLRRRNLLEQYGDTLAVIQPALALDRA